VSSPVALITGAKGDVVVQNGTRHAWRNKGTTPGTMLFFLNGAKRMTRVFMPLAHF